MLILDIPCQQFGDKCKLEGFFVPFGHRDGKCTFIEIYMYIGYMRPTIWRACNRCMLILDISCQQFEDKCKLEGFFVPFGHRDGKCIFIEIYIYIGYMLPTIWRAC